MQQFFYIGMALFFPFLLSGQNVEKIMINNESGQPLSGVVIIAEALSFFETSDGAGVFQVKIEEDQKNATFTFSHLGYQTVEYTFVDIQKNKNRVVLKGTAHELEEVEVFGRRDEQEKDLSAQVLSLDVRKPSFVNSQTTADLLEQSGQVFVQKSQMGGGSPVVRGFEANRVLLVVDGIRMNNAIYRSGHLQNSISIDKESLAGVEVIFGPGALTYGSDALGGVVHFRTQNPTLKIGDSTAAVKTILLSRFNTANKGKSIHASVNFGQKNWAVLSSISYNEYGHLRSGTKGIKGFDPILRKQYVKKIAGRDSIFTNEDPYLQVQTGFKQYDITQKWKFRWSERWDLLANIQYSTTTDIPRYDQLTALKNGQLKFAEWYYGPQERLLTALQFRWQEPTRWFDKALVLVSRQFIEEDRYTRKLYKTKKEVSLVDVEVWSATVDFEKSLRPRHLLLYGTDWSNNKVTSTAYSETLETMERTFDVPARYPDGGSDLSSWGIYLNYRFHNQSQTGTLNSGIRYAYSRLNTRFTDKGPIQWPAAYQVGIQSDNQAVIASIGWKQSLKSGLEYRLVGATSFRAPNVDDFAKVREKNGFVTIPNPNLVPEKSINGELGLTWKHQSLSGSTFSVGGTMFYTYLKDGIAKQLFQLPDGSDYFVSHEDTLTVQANVNSDNASVYGVSSFLNWKKGRWSLESNWSYTVGKRDYIQRGTNGETVFSTVVPMGHIPPLYGRSSINYQLDKLEIAFVIRYNGRKKANDYAVGSFNKVGEEWIPNRKGTADNIEDAWVDSEGNYLGTPAWVTTNLYLTWSLLSNWKWTLSFENIGDVHYRNFSSGVSSPGRNLTFSLKAMF